MSEIANPKRLMGGFLSLEGGMNSGVTPNLVAPNQCAFAVNCTMRGGFITHRPGQNLIPWLFLDASGNPDATLQANFLGNRFQHLAQYQPDIGSPFMVAFIGGMVFKIVVTVSGAKVKDISIPGDLNASNITQGWSAQGNNYLVYQDGQSLPIIFDGATCRRATAGEIKVGTVITYGMGRFWCAGPTFKTFRGYDLTGSSSGTAVTGFRDAVLKDTQNTFLNSGGDFTVPSEAGEIRAMRFIAIMDVSMGQGPLMVFCENGVLSVNAPADATTWKNLTYPILTSAMVNTGAMAHLSTITINADVLFLSRIGINSFTLSRLQFGNGWSNTAVSTEMNRVLDLDDDSLLGYSSAILFDNRFLVTCSPHFNSNGISHRGIVALDFNLISGMAKQNKPAWDGLWVDRDVMQLLRMDDHGVESAFAFCRNDESGQFELWQITVNAPFDNTDQLIVWGFETSSLSAGNPFGMKKLDTGEVWIDKLLGVAAILVQFHPDQTQCWFPWVQLSMCSTRCDPVPKAMTCQPRSLIPSFRPKVRLCAPADTCDPQIKRNSRLGFEHQFKFTVFGHLRIKQARFSFIDQPEPSFAETAIQPPLICAGVEACCDNDFEGPSYRITEEGTLRLTEEGEIRQIQV